MKKTEFNFDTIPDEVLNVWAIQTSGQPVGLETFEMMQKVIDDNPKWFPWEHKYKSIPQEVHDAYYNEVKVDFSSIFSSENDGRGFMAVIEDSIEETKKEIEANKNKSLIDLMTEFFEATENSREDDLRRKAESKAIWDKHYKKYGLEYRG